MKADVGTLGSLMEDCFARHKDFTACDSAAELPRAVAAGIELGSGPNKIEVAGASRLAYELIGVTQTGARFVLAATPAAGCATRARSTASRGCSPHGAW